MHVINDKINPEVLKHYMLPLSGIHGAYHWGSVIETSHRIADTTGADGDVIKLFALFHDCRRNHGIRGGRLCAFG